MNSERYSITQRHQQTLQAARSVIAILILLLGQISATLPAVFAEGTGSEDRYEIKGTISALPASGLIGDWKVAERVIHVTAATKIDQEDGAAAVGAFVEIKGTPQTDGSVNASTIEVKLSSSGGSLTEFTGAIETLPSTTGRIGDWKVAGRVVRVSATTLIKQENGQVAAGVLVEVKGTLQSDNSINALVIETKSGTADEAKILGKIEELPSTPNRIGDWKVAGRVVHVTASTILRQEDGAIAIGVTVKVEGVPQADGSINATEIETKSGDDAGENRVKFRGTVEALPGTTGQIGNWRVSGRVVRVTSTTKIRQEYGPVAVNSIVEVEGSRQTDNSVIASEIEVESQPAAPIRNNPGYCRFYGTIRALPSTQGFIGEWTVGGIKVNVVPTTTINQEKGQVAVGALVEGWALPKAGGLEAVRIEVKGIGNSAGYLKFFGTISALPATQNFVGDWTVGGKTVHVTSSTRIRQERGKVVTGAFVEVVGNQRTDGSVDATEIEVRTDNSAPNGSTGFVSFYANVTALPSATDFIGNWTAGGKTIHVTASTKIEQERGRVAVGALVEVKGNLRQDGSVDATKIEVKATSIVGGGDATFIEVVGKIEKLPDTKNFVGDWLVNGMTVRVSATTFIKRQDGTIAVGTLVEVKGAMQANGSIDATVIEVKRSSYYTASAPLTSVSASSYQPDNGSDSIVAAFGAGLSTTTASAAKLPLPTSLGGVSVLVDGKPAGLFFVSPTQINYLVPEDAAPGTAQVTVVNNNRVAAQGALSLPGVAPAVFTADASGQGVPAGLLLRVRANQQQSYEALARYDAASRKFVAAPIVRQSGDELYLVLFGTGLRNAPDTDNNSGNGSAENVLATIGGVNVPVLYAGKQGSLAGLDQLNLLLPETVLAGQNVTITIRVNDGQGNLLRSNTVTVAIQ